MYRIAVSSFKGGTAKTSTTLHLGAALVKFYQKKVLLVDFDAQANLSTGLGFDPDEHPSLAEVLQEGRSLESVIRPTHLEGLDLIPADTWLERVEVTGCLASDRYSHERLRTVLQQATTYDYILIDTPPSLCWLTESALIASTHALVCATPEFYSVKGLQRLSLFLDSTAQRHPMKVLGVVLSFWNARGKNNRAFLDVVESTFAGKLFKTKVRRDICVSEASIYGKPLFDTQPASRAAEDYEALTLELMNRLSKESVG